MFLFSIYHSYSGTIFRVSLNYCRYLPYTFVLHISNMIIVDMSSIKELELEFLEKN